MAALACDASRPDRTNTAAAGGRIGSAARRSVAMAAAGYWRRRDRRRAVAELWSVLPRRPLYDLDETADAIERGIGTGRTHRTAVDIGRRHRPPQGAGGGDAQARPSQCRSRMCRGTPSRAICKANRAPTGSRAWCRDGRCRTPAPPRSRCRCGCRDVGAVVGAVHDEAAGGTGRTRPGFAYPILRRDTLEAQRLRRQLCLRPQRSARELFSHRGRHETHRHPPAAGADIHTAHGNVVGTRTLGDQIDDRRADCSSVSRSATTVGLQADSVCERTVLTVASKLSPEFTSRRGI